MRPATVRLLVGALALGSLALACQSPLPSERSPLAEGDPLPAALLQSLADRVDAIQSVRGLANLSVDSAELRFRRPQRFAAQRPDSLRVETLGLFSQIAAVLVTTGDRYQFFDASNPAVQEGWVADDLLAQIAGIDLPPDEVVDLLLGTPRLDTGLRPHAASRLGDGGTVLHLAEGDGGTPGDLEFDALGRLRQFRQSEGPERGAWLARFDDYRDIEGIPFAHQVELHFVQRDSVVMLRFSEVELNPLLSPEVFVLRIRRAQSLPLPRAPGFDPLRVPAQPLPVLRIPIGGSRTDVRAKAGLGYELG